MKKPIAIISLLIYSVLSYGQDTSKVKLDTPVKVIDSNYYFNDTIVVKIPATHIQTFQAMLLEDDHSYRQHVDIINSLRKQIEKQVTKKPTITK